MTGNERPESHTTAVFGLTREQLRPIVEDIAGDSVRCFDLAIEHELGKERGYTADKVIPTVAYTTASGRSAKTTVFAKHFHEPGPQEAHHYAHLALAHAPVARMYGSLTGPDGREIIFLEFLERPPGAGRAFPLFDRFLRDADSLVPFLDLGARFNARPPSEDHRALLHVQTTDELRRWLGAAGEALERIWERAPGGELGDGLSDLCRGARDKLPGLRQLAADLVEPVSRMTTGLVHGDFYPDHTLRRQQTGELVLVDLHGVGLRPRFADVARWLGASDEVQPRCRPREELAQHYLEAYRRWGGTAVPLHEFLNETRLLALADELMMLPFSLDRSLDGKVDWTQDTDEGRRVFREEMHRQLRVLLHGIP